MTLAVNINCVLQGVDVQGSSDLLVLGLRLRERAHSDLLVLKALKGNLMMKLL